MARTILRKKNSAGGIIFLTSDYIKKPQSSKQYGTGMHAHTHTHTHTKQTQTHRSMKQDREPGNKVTHLWLINLQQNRQEYTMEKIQSLQ